MESNPHRIEGLQEDIPTRYTREQAERLSDEEFEELNALVDVFPQFAADDARRERWQELDNKVHGR
jgi:hypothetical protein